MPRISAFYGIVIAMYYNDHAPPHFHAIYSGDEAQIAIETLQPIRGSLPTTALRLIRDWGELHRVELEQNWIKARDQVPLDMIEPLS
jgi:hypothetical protein